MTVRAFRPDDAARVAEIQRAAPEASQWSVQSDPSDVCLVIERERVEGFLLCRQIAPGEVEILNLAVDPGARRQGLARRLLQAALERCPGIWYLEVRESNAAAQKLYEMLGFRVCGRRTGYYKNPTETGIVMTRIHDANGGLS